MSDATTATPRVRDWQRYLAELTGTFALVFAGTGAIVVNDSFDGVVTHLGIALAFGLVVMAMIQTIGDVSGAHINPAVSLAFYLARRFPGRDVAGYVAAQCAGAILASLAIRALLPAHPHLGATLPAIGTGAAFGVEVVLAFVLMFVILSVSTGAREKGILAGVTIGGVIALVALVAGPLTGASMNPARSLGPALVSGELSSLWVYLVAPIAGASLAIVQCRLVREPGCCLAAERRCPAS